MVQPDAQERAMQAWVRSNGKPVAPPLWRLGPARGASTFQVRLGGQMVTMQTPELFDMRR
jgi:hypothetical protein